MRRLLILVAALALLTTACKIEINAHFTIEADQSGAVTLEIGLDDEVLQFAAASGEDPSSLLGDFDLEDVPGAVTSEERRGDMTFYIVDVPIEDYTEAEGLAGEVTEGLAENFEITFTEDLVTVRGSTTLEDALGDSDEMGLSPEAMAEFFAINIRVTMPGNVLEHNATSQDGNTLTWAIDLAGGSLDIFAQSNPNESAGGSNMVLLIVVIAAAAAAIALLLFLWMRSRRGAVSAPAAPAAPTADLAPPPAPPPAE